MHDQQKAKLSSDFTLFYNLDKFLTQTKHGVLTKLGMLVYVAYLLVKMIVRFFAAGLIYALAGIFFDTYLSEIDYSQVRMFEQFPWLADFYRDSGSEFFSWSYLILMALTILVTVALPIDK